MPLGTVAARDVVEAPKNGYEYRLDDKSSAWTLYKKIQQPVLVPDPQAVDSANMQEVVRAFRLRAGLTKFPVTQEALNPFPATDEGLTSIDFETRPFLRRCIMPATGSRSHPSMRRINWRPSRGAHQARRSTGSHC